jgi:hypothetical protein
VKRVRTDTKTDWTTSITAKSELDNRADTCCASVNFRPLEFNGMSCSVTPFHTDYPSMEQIPVATCATAVDMLDGSTIILIIHEALYFGAGMDHSLINPNQIRITGIPVNDDPFDMSRPFGIGHPGAYIPFSTEGATIYFRSRTPTNEELDHYKYRQIELTDDTEWDPLTIQLEKATKPVMPFAHARSQAKAVHTIRCMENQSDCVLRGVSEVLVSETFHELPSMDSVSSYQEMHNIQGVVSATRHSKVSPEELARKWGIGIEAAKNTLRVTTQ